MHITRQTPQELVVVAGTGWVSAICAAAALFTLYVVTTRHEPKGFLLVAFLLLFALIMDLRKTFIFDATERIVRWHGRRVFKSESGEIPFDEITGIDTEAKRAGQRDVPVYRLTIITPRATIPMAYAYSGQSDRFSTLRGQILDFVKPGSKLQSRDPVGRTPYPK
jgi:hypothetical protein